MIVAVKASVSTNQVGLSLKGSRFWIFTRGADITPLTPDTCATFDWNGNAGDPGSGSVQHWTVPTGVTRIWATLHGGQGGTSNKGANRNPGGLGQYLQFTKSVVPGTAYDIYVGAGPSDFGALGWQAGWPNGGNGGHDNISAGSGGGGGSSHIVLAGGAFIDALGIAGGGGGAGNGSALGGGDAGMVGQPGKYLGGGGGTDTAGGVGGTGSGFNNGTGVDPGYPGAFNLGASQITEGTFWYFGGAGGGGWYGGGSGANAIDVKSNLCGDGGGGSGHLGPGCIMLASGVSWRTGNGQVEICWVNPT